MLCPSTSAFLVIFNTLSLCASAQVLQLPNRRVHMTKTSYSRISNHCANAHARAQVRVDPHQKERKKETARITKIMGR
jgi:hypothetical protein